MDTTFIFRIAPSRLDVRSFNEGFRREGIPGYRLSCNGSFFFYPGGPGPVTVGPVGLDGENSLKSGNQKYAYKRGTLARIGARISVRRLIDVKGGVAEDVNRTFSIAKPDKVSELMGGGFMLVDNGIVQTNEKIDSEQGVPGKTNYQLTATRGNIIFANDKSGNAYLIMSVNKALRSPLAIAALLGAEFPFMALFDGGGPFWFRDRKGQAPSQDGRSEPPMLAVAMVGDFVRSI